MNNPHLFFNHDIELVNRLTTREFAESETEFEFIKYENQDESIREHLLKDEDGETYCYIDLEIILNQIKKWYRLFPGIQPFYAVKCFPDVGLIKFLASTGVMGFDCASKGEIEKTVNYLDHFGKIIFAHPIKSIEHLIYAKNHGIYFMTLDNVEEFSKIIKVYDEMRAQVLVRLAVDDSHAVNKLGSKFGATEAEIQEIFQVSLGLPVDIVGISFHVGSGCMNAESFHLALETAHNLYQYADELGIKLKYLDIGGGFPGLESKITCEQMSKVILLDIKKYFENITVIAEPGIFSGLIVGRYFAELSTTICCRVIKISKMKMEDGSLRYIYRLNEGVNGVFKDRTLSNIDLFPEVIVSSNINGEKFSSSLLGDTMSKFDVIWPEIQLPELKIGDWISFKALGAYSLSISSVKYNHNIVYLISKN